MLNAVNFTKSSAIPTLPLMSALALALVMLTPGYASTDPTLSRIAADEPIHQIGFPPIPDHADLPEKGNTWSNNDSQVANAAMPTKHPRIIAEKTKSGYDHLPAGAFVPDKSSPRYRSSNSKITTGATTNSGSISTQLGPEPSLDPRKDQGINAEIPAPVMVKQSTTQDLSLPDDEFSKQGKPKVKNGTGSAIKRQLTNPVRQVGNMGSGLMGRIRF